MCSCSLLDPNCYSDDDNEQEAKPSEKGKKGQIFILLRIASVYSLMNL